MRRRPSQLNFVAGIKFNFLGGHICSTGSTDIYELPEAHRHGRKTASEVPSMLHPTVSSYKLKNPEIDPFYLHAHIREGQNTNKFMPFNCACKVLMGFEKKICWFFLIARHTKKL